jgi:hypothetical protein
MGPWTFPTSGQDNRIMYKENNCTKKMAAQKIPEQLLQQWCTTSVDKLSFWGLKLFPWGLLQLVRLFASSTGTLSKQC